MWIIVILPYNRLLFTLIISISIELLVKDVRLRSSYGLRLLLLGILKFVVIVIEHIYILNWLLNIILLIYSFFLIVYHITITLLLILICILLFQTAWTTVLWSLLLNVFVNAALLRCSKYRTNYLMIWFYVIYLTI